MATLSRCKKEEIPKSPEIIQGDEQTVTLVFQMAKKDLTTYHDKLENSSIKKQEISPRRVIDLKDKFFVDAASLEESLKQAHRKVQIGKNLILKDKYQFDCGTTRIICLNSNQTGFFKDVDQEAHNRLRPKGLGIGTLKEQKGRIEENKVDITSKPPFELIKQKQYPTDRPKVVVAVVDSGIDFSHPALQGFKWNPENIWAINNCSEVYDDGIDFTLKKQLKVKNYHGTHIAGIISGNVESNHVVGKRVGFPSEKVKLELMNLKIGDNSFAMCHAIAAIHYAIENNADIINLSLGFYLSESLTARQRRTNALFQAIRRAEDKGILVVCAAGNNGHDFDNPNSNNANIVHYPSGFSEILGNKVLSVGSSKGRESKDSLAIHSNRGVTAVNFAAPGYCVYSTYSQELNDEGEVVNKRGWAPFTGTSMAAAHISRLAAQVLGENRNEGYEPTLSELIDLINNKCSDLASGQKASIRSGKYYDV